MKKHRINLSFDVSNKLFYPIIEEAVKRDVITAIADLNSIFDNVNISNKQKLTSVREVLNRIAANYVLESHD